MIIISSQAPQIRGSGTLELDWEVGHKKNREHDFLLFQKKKRKNNRIIFLTLLLEQLEFETNSI